MILTPRAHIFNTEFSFQGRTISRSVSRRPVTTEAHVQSLGSRCGVGTVSFLGSFCFPLLVLLHKFSVIVFSLILSLSEGYRGEGWEICNKAILFRVSGSVVQNLSSSYVSGFIVASWYLFLLSAPVPGRWFCHYFPLFLEASNGTVQSSMFVAILIFYVELPIKVKYSHYRPSGLWGFW
jgi:hypothetical protein